MKVAVRCKKCSRDPPLNRDWIERTERDSQERVFHSFLFCSLRSPCFCILFFNIVFLYLTCFIFYLLAPQYKNKSDQISSGAVKRIKRSTVKLRLMSTQKKTCFKNNYGMCDPFTPVKKQKIKKDSKQQPLCASPLIFKISW